MSASPAYAHAALLAEHEALTQFLYRAPVGLDQAAADGAIQMIDPVAARLLMPLQRAVSLDNPFDALARVAPGLRHRCAAFARPHGMVRGGRRVPPRGAAKGARRAPRVMAPTLPKLDGAHLMAVLADVAEQARRALSRGRPARLAPGLRPTRARRRRPALAGSGADR